MRSAVALACVTSWVALTAALAAPSPAIAVPPPGMAVSSAALGDGRWVHHQVIPGERLAEIAERYAVTPERIARWNRLDTKRPLIRAGHELRIYTSTDASDRVRQTYRVRRGDSWSTIAKRFGVSLDKLRGQWNPKQKALQPGDRVVVFVERAPEPEAEEEFALEAAPTLLTSTAVAPQPTLPEVPVGAGGRSTGSPNRGRLLDGVPMPANPSLYTVRNPEETFGSSHAVAQLQAAIRNFREQSRYAGELVVMDMSRQKGGRFRPHRSHQSGRDVDIKLPSRASGAIDWDATWALVRALEQTGQVRFIFLSRTRQRALYAAAKRAGVSHEQLQRMLQFPRKARSALVRHARGHVEHLHVRFACAPEESSCVE